MRFRHIIAGSVLLFSSILAKADTLNFSFAPSTVGVSQGLSSLSFNLSSADPSTVANSVSFTYSNVLVTSGGVTFSEFVSFGHDTYYEFAVGSNAARINPGNVIGPSGGFIAYAFTNGVLFNGTLANPTLNAGTFVGGTGVLTVTQVASTPEPSSLALLGTGVVGVAGALKRRIFAT